MLKNTMQLFAKKPAPANSDPAPTERRPLGPLRQLPAVESREVRQKSVDSDSTIRPNKAPPALIPAAKTLRGEAARAAHPLPAVLQYVDPYAPAKPAAPRRPCSPGLRRKKSDSTLQLHKENTHAELAAPIKDNEVDRQAREKWRYMLGGRQGRSPQAAPHASTQAIIEKAVHVDELFLTRCERSTVGLCREQRGEVTHISRYGLSAALRDRAKEMLKKQDPYLRLLWRKVNNPAAQAALASQSSQTPGAGAKAKSCTPKIRLLQTGHPGGGGLQATPSIAEVVSDSGTRYLVAQPSNSGSFKRFSVGLTEDGKPIGVLLMRGPGSRDIFGDAHGEDLDLDVIDEEIKNLSAYSDAFEIYDAFPVHNVWYVMVPLYDAGSLADMFMRLNPETRYATALRLLPSMLEQMVSLHTKHEVLHRDVKMDNFFCTALGDVVLADFGLTAKLDANKAVNEGFGGTFFAPEQILNMRVTQAVDLWSLGASLGDLFIPPSRSPTAPRNPHIPVYSDEGEYDVEAHMAQVNLFGKFRKMFFDDKNEGLFEPGILKRIQLDSRIDSRLINMVQYYREFNTRAPLLARFCLEHLLEPNPALRSSEHAAVLLQLSRIMADALGVSSVSSEARKLPVDRKIAAAVEALQAALVRYHPRSAQAAS